jgi:hypothetical protein
MRGPAEDSTPPEPTGPEDERFVYHLTPEGQQVLAEHERATGERLHEPAAPATEVADAVDRETRRRRRQARAQRARRRGRRFGTVSYRWCGEEYVPALRVSGKWLRRAGFDRQQEFEITVRDRQLVIDAL